MSYIVKNCPCFVSGVAIKGNDKKVQTCNNHKIRELTYCADCTDCVIKQVIEKCKEHPFKDCACGDEILQLFDIEEVKE